MERLSWIIGRRRGSGYDEKVERRARGAWRCGHAGLQEFAERFFRRRRTVTHTALPTLCSPRCPRAPSVRVRSPTNSDVFTPPLCPYAVEGAIPAQRAEDRGTTSDPIPRGACALGPAPSDTPRPLRHPRGNRASCTLAAIGLVSPLHGLSFRRVGVNEQARGRLQLRAGAGRRVRSSGEPTVRAERSSRSIAHGRVNF